MLRVARQGVPQAALAQADLNRRFPVRRGAFDAVLSALVSEHSAFHPELARAGIEANFEQDGTEYRLGAERYTVSDYLDYMVDAGFRKLEWREYRGGDQLVQEVPTASKYKGRPQFISMAPCEPGRLLVP